MQKLTSSEGLLIVVELGAEWPASEIECSRNAKARRVLAQDETESPAAFALRVSEQLGSSFPGGVALGGVIVACSERLDLHAQAGRAELARIAASTLGRSGGGSLSFVASDRNGGRSKPSLSSLLAELIRQWQSAGVEVKLSFGESPVALAEGGTPSADPASRTGARTSPPVKDAVRRVA
ncbi:MAG TPA: hypothetical protein VER12_14500 [Polyangiaceae bacterium]|nr:hypothetical protein [Polyangiaceae bacterium]